MADFLDNFTGSAGTLLDAHTADSGESYTKIGGAWAGTAKLDGAGLCFNANGNNLTTYYSSWDPGADDYDVTMKFTSHTAADYMGLVARGSGTDNTDVTHYEVRYNAASGLVELVKVTNGSFSTLQTSSTTITTGDTLTGQFRGTSTTSITVKKNSTTLFTYDDSSSPLTPASGGKIGVFSYGGTDTSTGFSADQLTATATLAATTLTLTGPTTSTWGAASTNYTVTPNGTVTSDTVTPHSSGGSDVLTPSTLTFTNSSAAQTFTVTGGGATGNRNITITDSGGLTIAGSPIVLDAEYPVATTYTLTAPSPASGAVNVASNDFTIALPANTRLTGTVTFTPYTTGSGSFTPATADLDAVTTSVTFKYTPSTAGTHTISTTNSSTLTDPAGVTYTATNAPATAVAVTLPSPAGGYAGTASGNILVAVNGTLSGTVHVTMSDGGAGGSFSVGTITLNASTLSANTTYTPAVSRNTPVTISETNDGGLSDDTGKTYTVNRPTFSASPSSIGLNQAGVSVTLTGVGTRWLTNTPTFTLSGVSGVALTGQSVTNNTTAVLTVSTMTTPGSLTVNETASGGSCMLTVSSTISIDVSTDSFGPMYAGLVGTVGYGLYDSTGTIVGSRVTSGVYEVGTLTGIYKTTIAVPNGETITIVWDTGGSNPERQTETINVAAVAPPLTDASIVSDVTTALTAAATESYAANGAPASVVELLYEIWSLIAMLVRSGTTLTSYKRDGTTPATSSTLNDAVNPTSRKRTG